MLVFLFITSDDAELLWRLARASRDLAQLSSTSAEEKRQLAYEAFEYAKKALEKNESNFAAHKVSQAKEIKWNLVLWFLPVETGTNVIVLFQQTSA